MTIYVVLVRVDGDDCCHYYSMPYDLIGHIKAVGIKWLLSFRHMWYFSEKKCDKYCEFLNNAAHMARYGK